MKIGQEVEIKVANKCKKTEYIKGEVIALYPHFARVMTKAGYTVCVNEFDLKKDWFKGRVDRSFLFWKL